MRRGARVLLFSALVGATAIVAAVGYVLFAVTVSNGLAMEEVDWNGDGQIAVSEVLDAIDIRKRAVLVAGETCQEYFSLKDGLTVRLDC